MAEGARIYSTDALAIFRAALIKFSESGNSALTSADSDIERMLGWLEREQTVYWASQVRKRHDRVLQLEDAVRQKRLYKEVDGTTKSAVDEMKMLQAAKRAEDEAVQKTVTVKRAIGHLRKEAMMYKGRVQKLATTLQSDIPAAVHSLDQMMDHIEAYLQLQSTGEGINLGGSVEQISRAAGSEKVGLERLRDQTPKPDQRLNATFTVVGPDHPMHQPWKAGVMQDWQLKMLAGLGIDRALPDPDTRVVLHPEVWTSSKIYLERLDPTSEQDSGWYIGPALDALPQGDPPAYIAVRLGDIIQARADFTELLGLPGSTLIVLDAGGPAAMFDQMGLDIWALAMIKAAEPAKEQPAPAPTDAPTDAPAETTVAQ
jgi:hypothetical protein